MMESVNDWELGNLIGFGYQYWTTGRRALVQRTMRSPRMIIIQVREQQSFEMPLVEDDDVIQKFSAKASDYALNIGILPR